MKEAFSDKEFVEKLFSNEITVWENDVYFITNLDDDVDNHQLL